MKPGILPYLIILLFSCDQQVEQIKEFEKPEKKVSTPPTCETQESGIEAILLERIKEDKFIVDTSRLKQIAGYAYRDLRKTPYVRYKGQLRTTLQPELHSMGQYGALKSGTGFYFVGEQQAGEQNRPDFTLEFWLVDTTKSLEQLEYAWKEKFHPMPCYFIRRNDTVLFFNTRSVQFIPVVEKYVDMAMKWK